MKHTQFLIFEIGPDCNLACQHRERCPSGDPDRYGRLDTSELLGDDQIINSVKVAHELGFKGLIGWHYYNEPTLYWDRLTRLTNAIRGKVPAARFILWTNGTSLPNDLSELSVFTQMWVSNYWPGLVLSKTVRAGTARARRPAGPAEGATPGSR